MGFFVTMNERNPENEQKFFKIWFSVLDYMKK